MDLKNETFQQLVERASDTVLLLDADGAGVYANAATGERFERRPEEQWHMTIPEQEGSDLVAGDATPSQ